MTLPSAMTPRADLRLGFARYRAIDHRLPRMPRGGLAGALQIDGLGALAAQCDGVILDAFGVLNIGESAIDGAVGAIAAWRAMGKRLVVLTNGASATRDQALARYRGWGFDFARDEVISSRDLAAAALAGRDGRVGRGGVWAAIAPPGAALDDLPGTVRPLDAQLLHAADGFLFLGSQGWDHARQSALAAALAAHPRPVICANPDVVAPRETGFTWEPGHFAHALPVGVEFHGKPFARAFEVALDRLGLPAHRVAMVGDSLHTDVLGGRAAGCRTVLVTGHGLFAGVDPAPFIAATGIAPDFITHSI